VGCPLPPPRLRAECRRPHRRGRRVPPRPGAACPPRTRATRRPLQELERRAAPGRHVAHLRFQPGLRDRRCRVAAADDRRCPRLRRLCHRGGDRVRSLVERRVLEHAHRPVPNHGLCRRDRPGVGGRGVGPDVVHRLVRRNPVALDRVGLPSRLDRRGDSRVVGEDEPRAGLVQECARHVHAVRLDERLPRLQSHGAVEGAGHRTPHEHGVHLGQQLFDHVDLAGDLGAAEDRDERALRLLQRTAEIFELTFHEQAGDRGLQVFGDARCGCVRPVRRAERVVHVQVAEPRQGPRQSIVVLLLAGEEAGVLEEEHLAVPKPLRRLDRVVPVGRLGEAHLRAGQELAESGRHRLQRILRFRFRLGAAEV
jgi:hypothetical protein